MTTPEPTPDHVPVYCSAHETYHGSLTHCDSCGRYQAHFPLEVCQTPHFHQPIHDAADTKNKRLRAELARLRETLQVVYEQLETWQRMERQWAGGSPVYTDAADIALSRLDAAPGSPGQPAESSQ